MGLGIGQEDINFFFPCDWIFELQDSRYWDGVNNSRARDDSTGAEILGKMGFYDCFIADIRRQRIKHYEIIKCDWCQSARWDRNFEEDTGHLVIP